ncbi:MAG TPA: hypothetical protein VMH78_08005 [Thermoplasmata archaeon]|nr:hypothetical protein [Thermoplasmata archaeon]
MTTRIGWSWSWLPVALAIVVVASGNVIAPASAPPPATDPGFTPDLAEPQSVAPSDAAPISVPLSVGDLSSVLSPDFWGTTVNNEVHLLRGEGDAINATPTRVIVWPGAMAGEDYDPLTNTHYDTYSGAAKTALTSEAQFVQMCEAMHCTAIMQLPAEIDNPSLAEEIVNYTEVNLSFTPAYWMIGNEPELWEHWQVAWKNWGHSYTGGPTPTEFGQEVVAYVADIRQVDATTPILGLPASGCTCGSWTFSQWISAVLNVTGDKIQAVAFHEYPAGWLGTGDGSLLDFYQTIQSAASIPQRIISARQAASSACPGCNVSVFVSELGAALSWSDYGQYAAGFSGSLSIAAQMTQAMDVNLTNVDLFAAELATTNSWFNPAGYARPDYGLYTEIFDHLGNDVYPVNLTGLTKTIYGIGTVAPDDQGRQDLLVVNTNISHSISFTPQFPTDPGLGPTEAWYWNGSIHYTTGNHTTWVEPFTPNAIPEIFPSGLPTTFVLPPQSLVVFETYPAGATFVRVQGDGVPANTSWYTSVGSQFYTTTDANLSLLLPTGNYTVAGVPINLPIGGKEFVPSERLEPFVASPAIVSGSYTNVSLAFVDQWRVNITASPGDGGTVSPIVDWWNASEPLTLNAVPAPGYALNRWGGWGPGSYNGTGRTISVDPTGRIDETAHFVVGQPGMFWETGLPAGTPWSVLVREFVTNSTGDTLTVYEPNGTWAFHVEPVPGYRSLPQNGSISFLGLAVHIAFIPLTPAPPTYPVTFHVTGLPSGETTAIFVRGVKELAGAGAPDPSFDLLNGSYAYRLGYVDGLHASVPMKTFVVRGAPMLIDVPYVPTTYTATWQAVGTRDGLLWSVNLDTGPLVANSAWVSATLPNGTYPYHIELPANYSATPRSGVLVIAGYAAPVLLSFDLLRFQTGFEAIGPGSTNGWSVRLGNTTLPATANRSDFMAPNGTYTFDVHPPDGYYAVPSHGILTVAGSTASTKVQFYPSSEKPSAALVAELTSGALEVSTWVALSALLGFAVVRRIRHRGG